jgi:hypothetical protein
MTWNTSALLLVEQSSDILLRLICHGNLHALYHTAVTITEERFQAGMRFQAQLRGTWQISIRDGAEEKPAFAFPYASWFPAC